MAIVIGHIKKMLNMRFMESHNYFLLKEIHIIYIVIRGAQFECTQRDSESGAQNGKNNWNWRRIHTHRTK